MTIERIEDMGRSWDVKTPRMAISSFVGRQHCDTSDEKIKKKVLSAIKKSIQVKEYTPEIIQECLDYAMVVHHANQEVYKLFR